MYICGGGKKRERKVTSEFNQAKTFRRKIGDK